MKILAKIEDADKSLDTAPAHRGVLHEVFPRGVDSRHDHLRLHDAHGHGYVNAKTCEYQSGDVDGIVS
jgi:hypothetical protein